MAKGNPKSEERFSRRHKTVEARNEVRARRQARQTAKKRGALERQQEAERRSPEEQLRRLDEKFGVGQGAQKERARLERLVKGTCSTCKHWLIFAEDSQDGDCLVHREPRAAGYYCIGHCSKGKGGKR